MKELSIEEKAKRYDEALSKAKEQYDKYSNPVLLEYIFPEFKKSNDERIRKKLINCVSTFKHPFFSEMEKNEFIAWLEKQGESDETRAKMFLINKGYPIDANGKFPTYEELYNIIKEGLENQGEQEEPQVYETEDGEVITYSENEGYKIVEPMFKAGDWLVHNERRNIIKVVNATPLDYKVVDVLGYHHTITDDAIENNYHLWTIKDAKDGDILIVENIIFIYKRALSSHIVLLVLMVNFMKLPKDIQ